MMEFTEEFEFLERELSLDFDDKSLRATQKRILQLERRLDDILSDDTKFPNISNKTYRKALKSLYGRQLSNLATVDFDELARSELRQLSQVPEKMWSAFNTINIMNPGKIPSETVTLINARMRQYNLTSREIHSLLGKKKQSPDLFTEEEETQLQDKMAEIRRLESHFLQGIDDHVIRLGKVFSKDIKNLNEYVNTVDLTFKGISDTAANIQSTGGALFSFLRTGKDLPKLAGQIKSLLSNGYKAYLAVVLQELEQGKKGDNVQFRNLVSGKGPKKNFTRILMNLGSSFINNILKFAGPYGKLAALAVSIATYFISKRQERIEFNSSLAKSVGLVDGLAMMDFRIEDPEKRMEAYYSTVFDYFTDRDSEYHVRLPNGDLVTRSSNAIELNLDTDKYVELLGGLVQAGVTMRDLEQEFGMAYVKPNMLGNVRTDVIPNMKTPLEQYYTVAKAFSMDPAEVAKVIGDWKYNYGDLVGEINNSFGSMYVQAQSLGVNSNDFLRSVSDLSSKFSVYSNQANILSKALTKMLSKGLYGLQQGKQLLEGVLAEVRGFTIQQLEGLLTNLFYDSKDRQAIPKLLKQARENIKQELAKKQKELASKTTVVERDQLDLEIAMLSSLEKEASKRINEFDSRIFNFKRVAGFFDAYAEVNVTGNLQLLDKAILARQRNFIKADKARSNNLLLSLGDISTVLDTLGLSSKNMKQWAEQSVLPVQARVYGKPPKQPKEFDTNRGFEVMQKAALALATNTESFASQATSALQPWGTKIYNAALSAWRFVEDIGNTIFGVDPKEQTPEIRSLGTNKVQDLSGNLPKTLPKIPLTSPKKIVIATDTAFNTKVNSKESSITKSYHYGIDENGNLVQYLPENVQAKGLGNLSTAIKGLPNSLDQFALSININPPQGSSEPRNEYYLAVAQSVAAILVHHKLKPSDVNLQSAFAKGSRRDLGKINWGKLREYLQASYDIQVNGAQSASVVNPNTVAQQLANNLSLQELFKKAFLKAEGTEAQQKEKVATFSQYTSFQDFEDAFLESLSVFSTDFLKNASKRNTLLEWFSERFGLTTDGLSDTLKDLFDKVLARAIAERQMIEASAARKKIKFQKFAQNKSLVSTGSLITGVDESFRAAFADKLENGTLGNSVALNQYFLNVFLSDSGEITTDNLKSTLKSPGSNINVHSVERTLS